jgi:hypothetical protein
MSGQHGKAGPLRYDFSESTLKMSGAPFTVHDAGVARILRGEGLGHDALVRDRIALAANHLRRKAERRNCHGKSPVQ